MLSVPATPPLGRTLGLLRRIPPLQLSPELGSRLLGAANTLKLKGAPVTFAMPVRLRRRP